MNGQPTAENTRETGADGTLPGFRNWQNDEHVREIAEAWNVDILQIPHWAPPTHALEIFRHIEDGSIRFLWVTGTNPLVSMPELRRIRSVCEQQRLFLVVSDAFMTETAAIADVVLPAALWAEKTGCYTNADRTVHLSEKAVEPPGQARSDLEIFCDYANRLGLRDKDGAPLITWSTPEAAWTAFTEITRGRPCDQSALTYAKLRGGSGIQWPCTDASPDGTERLYADAHFPTEPTVCESYGHDLLTGAENEADEYRAHDPGGRAVLKAADFTPPNEPVDDDYPFQLTTGRTVYHWHTRTKTARAAQLQDAAPAMWVELCREDAQALGVAEGDIVRLESRRGAVEAPARLSGTRPGTVFAPFHYGYWDRPPNGSATAANELTRTEWDPVSKQPIFKVTAVRVTRIADRDAEGR
jgi:anaerobic selenocysteine-containing dehydrogenase